MVNRFFFLFLSLALISCSSKIDVGIDLDSLKNEGDLFKQNENLIFLDKKIEKINSIIMPDNKSGNINFSSLTKKKFFSPLKNNNFKKEIINYNDKIIYIDDQSNLYIINKKLKSQKKIKILNKDIKNFPIKFSLLIDNDILYGADNFGSIFSFDLKNNDFLWHNFLNVPFFSNIVSYKDYIFALNANGKIFSFSKLDGKVIWSQEIGSGIIKSYDSFKILNVKDKLVFTNDLGFVYCLDLLNKNSVWSLKIPLKKSKTSNSVLKLSNLVFDEKFIYISSNLGGFLKIDLNTGEIIWSLNIFSNQPIFVSKKHISLLTTNGFLTIVNKNSSEVMFNKNLKIIKSLKKNAASDIEFLDFFSSGKYLYIFSNFGDLLIFDSFNLKSINYKNISNLITSNIVKINEFVYFLADEGRLYQYK